jgi:ligand-binding sensor domain-containing protein
MSFIEDPQKPFNRPGLPSLGYRIGDYTSFRARLLEQLLSKFDVPGQPQEISLQKLTTRAAEDPAIALLDACAVVADVLTFYQERIINEGYILTATERRSVLEMARAIGYELDPGVAASTLLAFMTEDTPNSPPTAIIPQGTQVMSIPGQDESPQTFETMAEFVARVEWNAIKPRLRRSQKITTATRKLYLEGINTQLQPGDAILLMDGDGADGNYYWLMLDQVQSIAAAGHTLVTWNRLLSVEPLKPNQPLAISKPPRQPVVMAFRQQVNLFGHNAPRWSDLPTETKVANGSKVKGGVYRYAPVAAGTKWQSVNEGLSNFDVRCLVANSQGVLFAATAVGVFRSIDQGDSWTAVNSGLSNTNVQTILIVENNEILIGTAADGVFASNDNGGSWSSIGIGTVESKTTTTAPGVNPVKQTTVSKATPNTVVRSLALQKANTTPAKLSSSDKTITFSNNKYYLELKIGDLIIVGNENRTIDTIIAPQVTVNLAFSSNLTSVNFIVNRLDPPAIFSNLPNIPDQYLFASTDNGVYRSNNRGQTWKPVAGNGLPILANSEMKSLAVDRTSIFLRVGKVIYRSNDQGDNWSLSVPAGSTTIYDLTAFPDNVFVGANNGIHRWIDSTNNWQLVGLSTTDVFSVALLPGANLDVFAFTGIGAYKNNILIVGSDTLPAIDFKSLVSCVVKTNGSEQILAGVLFTGFEDPVNPTTPTKPKQVDWIDFKIPEQEGTPAKSILYLDTMYPRVLADTWIVLKTGDRFQPTTIKEISAKQHKRFSLDMKVTQLVIDNSKIKDITKLPTSFPELRETIVFAQSEPLLLAPDPLTIPVQQAQIFFDPIVEKQVFLSQYVTDLQPQQRVIFSGKRMRMEVKNIAGVAQLGTTLQWQRRNVGLTNTNVTCFASQGSNLFVGTIEGGVFWSANQGELWKSVNKDLLNLNIQTLIASAGFLFAGTAGGGIFRSSNNGERWTEQNENLIHRDVQVLLSVGTTILAGTVGGGVYRSNDNGNTWSQTSLDNTTVQALCQFNNQIWAGTIDDGVWTSKLDGFLWQPSNFGLAEKNVTNVTAFGANGLILLAGTAGSGIFSCHIDPASNPPVVSKWQPVSLNPTALNIRCITYNTTKSQFLAGTIGGGVFQSLDNGDRWGQFNNGLTCIDEFINPTTAANIDVRAISAIGDQVFVVGSGILISPDGLYTTPIRSGDRLQVLAPPQPLGTADPEEPPVTGQKWLVQDTDGFQGLVFSANPAEILLEPASKEDPIVSEIATIRKPPTDRQEPILKLADPIQNIYDPETVQIHANVVAATHGETIAEVMGSGDGITTNQKFLLNKPPLTHVAASNARGSLSTLRVRVNDVLWQESPNLYQQPPQAPIYITRIADDQSVTVTFGDGKSGNRLPSGRENIVAIYRTGIGLAGQMKAGQLSLLKTRPLGIDKVNNPLPATGAANPETMTEARVSAPLTTRTLDRIVSLQDYEDFARSFVGIGKAHAVALWTGNIQQVHITIGAIGGQAVMPETSLYENLVAAIENVRDPLQPVQVDSYESLRFNIAAKLLIDPRYLPAKVLAQVTALLKNRFAFEQQNFGRALTAAEVIATIQSIGGVVAVDLDALHRLDKPRSLEQSLPAASATWDAVNNRILPAQLLTLNPAGISLSVEVIK